MNNVDSLITIGTAKVKPEIKVKSSKIKQSKKKDAKKNNQNDKKESRKENIANIKKVFLLTKRSFYLISN